MLSIVRSYPDVHEASLPIAHSYPDVHEASLPIAHSDLDVREPTHPILGIVHFISGSQPIPFPMLPLLPIDVAVYY
jgi:hypothetical protein